ncbi:MAG: TetR/AcrR family transcriptional regulator, partial [Brevundimonas sp.]|uniref:TetR/AcrR family transcriptional regulator n=1 Tax=Brevundimonas sp. TaxID=1871086 RepID=UPI001A2542A7
MRDSVLPTTQTDADIEAPRLNRRQAAKVRTHAKVLEAARVLFAERGYDAATIRDIAKGAGMSTGAVFANFQDKSELFEAVLAENLAGTLEAFQAAATADGRAAERLTSALSVGYHRGLDHLPLVQAIFARAWFQPEDANERQRAMAKPFVESIAGILQAGIREGELRQDVDVTLMTRMIWELYMAN